MTEDEARQFLQTHRQAVMATIRKDGSPHLTNVLTLYQEGELWVSLTETRAKYRNLQRDPRCSLLLLGDNFWQFLTVDGRASFVRLPDAAPLLRQYYELASGGPHPNWEEYDEAMRNDRRVLCRVQIERMYPLDRA